MLQILCLNINNALVSRKFIRISHKRKSNTPKKCPLAPFRAIPYPPNYKNNLSFERNNLIFQPFIILGEGGRNEENWNITHRERGDPRRESHSDILYRWLRTKPWKRERPRSFSIKNNRLVPFREPPSTSGRIDGSTGFPAYPGENSVAVRAFIYTDVRTSLRGCRIGARCACQLFGSAKIPHEQFLCHTWWWIHDHHPFDVLTHGTKFNHKLATMGYFNSQWHTRKWVSCTMENKSVKENKCEYYLLLMFQTGWKAPTNRRQY